jgi:cytoskeletal protein RodZ
MATLVELMDLGTNLREARERAGLSLPELAARTRIPLKSLSAIEENDFAKVPPGVFIRSFIRTYAREVGVDPEAAISEFRAMTDPIAQFPEEAPAVPVNEPPPRTVEVLLSESRPGWAYALVAAALLTGFISVTRDSAADQPGATASAADAPATTAPVTATAPSATVAPGTDSAIPAVAQEPPPPSPVATTGSGVQLEMRAQGVCWVRATVDGQFAFARLMQPGEIQTLNAEEDVVVRVGDPAALSYSINGRAGQPLGTANVPVTIRFGTDGLASRVS